MSSGLGGSRPLDGVRVVDRASGIAGGYCTKLLADAGADVIKVEHSPDPLRDHSGGLLFEFLNTSKRAVRFAPDLIAMLYEWADLVVESDGASYDELAALNPAATMVSISPFGRSGPWAGRPASEFTMMAEAGSTSTRGKPGEHYINAGGLIGEWMGGVSAAVAAVAALRRAEASGVGDHVDVSIFESLAPTCTNVQSLWSSMAGDRGGEPRIEVPSIEPTKDGYVGFCIFTGQQWQDFCVLIGQPQLALDPELAMMSGRFGRADVLKLIRDYTTAHTTDEIIEQAVLLRVPVAPIGNGANVTAMEQFVARGVYQPNPSGRFLQPRVPYRIAGCPPRPFAPAPAPGEHDAAVRAELGSAALSRRPPAAAVATADFPLAGLRVVDMTAFWAGPYATYVLACLGADVIHVESIQRPDGMRFGAVRPPGTPQWWEWGPTFHAANAGKRSITLDLTREGGRRLLRRLIEQSDLLVENYSVRVLESFGLTWATVHEWNPRLVMVRMPAFGLDGPWRDRVGFAQTMEQTSGMAWLTGYADGDPMNARGPCDPLAGLHSAFAAIVGLRARDRDHEGVHIESTMVETALNAAAEQVIEWTGHRRLLSRNGNTHDGTRDQEVYRAADHPEGTVGMIAVCAETSAQKSALLRVTGGDVAAWCRARRLSDAVDALVAEGIPASPVRAARHPDRGPQDDHRGFYEAVTHPVTGTHRIAAFPAVFGRQPPSRFARPAPRLGEHNREVLQGLLGVTDAEFAALVESRIIGDRPLGADG